MPENQELRRLLWHILGGTRGGENRARIIQELHNRPSNLNQLSIRLKLEYRAIQHHVEVLRKNSLVVSGGEHYGLTYFLSPYLEANIGLFNDICDKLKLKFHQSASSTSPSGEKQNSE
ncbi:MAG: ArsR/SmtB family transcription factor [Nitrososphaerales archaeon]